MDQTADITIYFDGACEPVNPGGVATAGWYIVDSQEIDISEIDIAEGHRFIKSGDGATNNTAEWCALGFALRWLLDNYKDNCHGKNLLICGDSQLVCNQLTHTWQCRAPHLQKLMCRCLRILEQLELKSWTTQWIPREQNQRADDLSKLAYVEFTGKKPPQSDFCAMRPR